MKLSYHMKQKLLAWRPFVHGTMSPLYIQLDMMSIVLFFFVLKMIAVGTMIFILLRMESYVA